MVSIASVISTILGSLLLIMSIFILYFVTNPLARLGVITTFTTLFAATLAIFTKAKRVETVAATTAYDSFCCSARSMLTCGVIGLEQCKSSLLVIVLPILHNRRNELKGLIHRAIRIGKGSEATMRT